MRRNGWTKTPFDVLVGHLIRRVGTIVPILDENVIVNSFLKFPDYRPIHFKMVIDR